MKQDEFETKAKIALLKKKLQQSELSEVLGVSRSTIFWWVKGMRPSREYRIKYQAFLDALDLKNMFENEVKYEGRKS